MRYIISHYKTSLSTKLAFQLIVGMIVVFSITGYLNLRLHKKQLMAGIYQNAGQISDIIKGSTNYSMLRNERQSIYRIIHSIAQEPGILKIRIYNKEGAISFSTEPAEVGTEVNVHAEACIVCHSGPMPSGDVSIYERARDYYNSDGKHVLGVISPIKSEQSCVAAECHAHSSDQIILGVLDVIMQLDEVDVSHYEYEKRFISFVILAILAVCLISIISIYSMVYRPVNKIVEGTRRLAEGDLDFKIDVNSRDEIGGLAISFNSMAEKLKVSQNQLLSAKAYTDNVIQSMSNSLVVVDQNTIIQKVNKATCELLEYEEQELIGQPIAMIIAEGYFEDIGLDDLPIVDFDNTVETAYIAKSDKKIHVLFSGSVVRDEKGEFQGVVCMAQDITWQTEAMHAGHLTSLGELAAGVAHEINNPLNSIINFAQIMIDGIDNNEPVSKDIPATIIKEGDRMSSIVRSLLSFARGNETDTGQIKLYAVLQETLALTETQLVKEGITLQLNVSETLPEVEGNFQQIQQVFINIINNSMYALNKKYTGAHPEKILSIQATEETMEGQAAVKITFHDNGIGIPSGIVEKVMNPFFSTKPAGQGTGLGLAISHGIITEYNGKLLIESIVGEFTDVIIILPVWQADPMDNTTSGQPSGN